MSTMIFKEHTTTISDLRKSPRSIIDKARKNKIGVYVLSNNKPEAVVVDVDRYEKLLSQIEDMEEKILDMEVAQRLSAEGKNFHSDFEVRGKTALQKPVIDEYDGWE